MAAVRHVGIRGDVFEVQPEPVLRVAHIDVVPNLRRDVNDCGAIVADAATDLRALAEQLEPWVAEPA